MSVYAKSTSVSVEKSRGEIERTLQRYGASAFAYATSGGRAMIQFQASGRRIMFVLALPDPQLKEFWKTPSGRRNVTPERAAFAWEQACRQKWRCLALAIKAKLEAVSSDISTFEDEFMAHIVMPDGKTISQHMSPQIESAYSSGKMPPMIAWEPKS